VNLYSVFIVLSLKRSAMARL